MILPIIIGFVVGKFVSKKSQAVLGAVLIGGALGLIASSTLIPLLYPLFWGDAGLVVIPEAHAIGIMILFPDWIIYSEVVWRTRTFVIDLVFILTGVVIGAVSAWVSSRNQDGRISTPFEDLEV